MGLFLGVDGGGTGCRAAIADADGRILGRAESGPANIASGLAQAVKNLLQVSRDALISATGSADPKDFARLHAVFGLAGANAKGSVEALQQQLPFAARIVTDAVTTAKGALRDRDGIIAAMGTGSVFLRQSGGALQQLGGWGFALGDEGSGAVIGRMMLARALRAVDGIEVMTPLLRDVLKAMGGGAQIVNFGFTATPADFASLAPQVIGSDDPAALAIMATAFRDVARSIQQLQTKTPLPVIYLGGLGPTYAAHFADRWPQRAALGNSLEGALWLARQGAV